MNRRGFLKLCLVGLSAISGGITNAVATAADPIGKFCPMRVWGVKNIDGHTREEILKNGFGKPIWSAQIHVSRNLIKDW